MPYYQQEQSVATVADALNQTNADELKKLVKLLPTSERVPTRKGDLVTLIAGYP